MSAAHLQHSRVGVKILDRPLSTAGCILGWVIASIVFLGFTAWIGGPVQGDSALSVFTTWAIAHGNVACAYSLSGVHNLPTLARPNAYLPPLYPLFSSGVLALTHVTYNVPFPTSAQLGAHCLTSDAAMFQWASRANAIMPTIRIGYLTWIALMAGTISLLRASGRGRSGWEPATLLFLAVSAPVFECLTEYFHPQDILAMGLALGSLACALRGRWAWAGILIGCAFTSNQFALLFVGPMFVLVPGKWRIKFVTAAVAVASLISVPIIVLTSGQAFSATVLGTGFTPAPGGGTLLSETHLRGSVLFALARVTPILLSMALAWWAKQRLDDDAVRPIPFLSVIATALALRIVFEFSLFGYFFLGVATTLILIDFIGGHIRGTLLTWLALVTVFFDPFPWGFASNGQAWGLAAREWLPNIFLILVAAIILFDLLKHRIRWYLVAAGLLVGVTLVKWPWNHEALRQQLPTWIIQLALIPFALWLAIQPLLEAIRSSREVEPFTELASAAP